MVSEKVTVINPQGMHMRPAQIIATKLKDYPCNVTIKNGPKAVNAKSIMTIMTAAIKCGSEIEIECDGEKEAEALAMLVDLVKSGLGDL